MAASRRFAEVTNQKDSDMANEVEVINEVIVNDDLVSARIKGTWIMQWGSEKWNFEDGKRYRIPRDLYHYLKSRSCIYDTL